ncbi:MAG: MFS transporter [Thermoprotei archaeon]
MDRRTWLFSALPSSLATGPLSTFLALAVLDKGGTVVQYGLILSAASAAAVVASIFWGFLMDLSIRRWVFLFLSYGGVTVCVLSLYTFEALPYTAAAYVGVSFFSAAAAPASNLLIMQLWRRSEWSEIFGFYSYLGSAGAVLGLVISSVWVLKFSVFKLPLVFSLFSAASALVVLLTLKPIKTVPLERTAMTADRLSFIQRFLANPSFFLRLPRLGDFVRFWKLARNTLTRQGPLLYFSLFLFNVGSGLFNTSFNPSLISGKVVAGPLFAVGIFSMITQTFSMRYAGRKVGGSEASVAKLGLLLRILGYLAMVPLDVFFKSYLLAIGAAASYALAGGFAYSLFYVSSTSLVFESMPRARQGGLLGIISALSGIGSFIGSFGSGYLSYALGYPATFVAAALLLFFSYLVIRWAYP